MNEKEIYERIEKISQMEYNWDGYESPAISKISIEHTKGFISLLLSHYDNICDYITVWPNEYGGMTVKIINEGEGRCCIDFGDTCFSYYAERRGIKVQFYSFLEYDYSNVDELLNNIKIFVI